MKQKNYEEKKTPWMKKGGKKTKKTKKKMKKEEN
jgi:hypothetical protein